MGEELDKPEKTFSPIDKENIYLKFGFNQVQGWKKTMEDYSIEFLESNEKKFMNIFGIFDGHGGREVPKYLQAHFLEYLNKNKNFLTDKYKEGITETFFELDQKFTTKEAQEELVKYSEEFKPEKEKELNEINDLCSPNEKLTKEELEQVMAFNEVFDPRNIENANIAEFTGATGMIIAVCYKEILIAYAGNSRCLILDKDGKIINQTKDHTLLLETEKKRVDLARSFNDDEEEKKKGEDENIEFLDSTRGFGDLEFKGNEWIEQKDQEISVEPEIVFVPYNNAKYIIFGSHGMFEGDDNKINDEIGKYFFEEINKNKNNNIKFSDVIKNYFEKIIPEDKNKSEKNFGLDNMSCFVIELKNEEIEKFIKIRDEEIKEEKRKEEERKKKQKEEEMKRKAEEKKKREEERKRKEEEKNKKPEEKKEEVKPEEKKEEVKEEVKQEEKKEEVKEEKKEEIKEEEKKEEKPEEKKEEVKENIEEKKEEVKPEEKQEEKKEEKQEEKKEEKQEEIKEEVKEEKPEEKQEENKIEIKVEKQEEKPEEIKEEKQEEKKEEIKPEEKQEEKKEEKSEENKIEIVTEQKEEKPEEIKEEKPEEKPEEKQEEKKEEVKEENKIEEEKKEEEVKVEIQIEKKEQKNQKE